MPEHLVRLCARSSRLSPDELLRTILEALLADLHVPRGALLLLDDQGRATRIVASDEEARFLAAELEAFILQQPDGGLRRQESSSEELSLRLLPIPHHGSPPLGFLALPPTPPLEEDLTEEATAIVTSLLQNVRLRAPYLQQEKRTQREIAEAMAEAAALLSQSLDLDEVLDEILVQLASVVPHEASNVMLIEGGEVHPVRWRGYAAFGAEERIREVRFPATLPNLQRMVQSRAPVLFADTTQAEEWVFNPGFEWLRSYAAAPIVVDDEVLGFINVDSAQPNFFDVSDSRRLATFADYAAIALKNARFFAESRQRQGYLESLNRVAATANSDLPLERVLQVGLNAALTVSGMQGGRVYLWNPAKQRACLRAAEGLPEEILQQHLYCLPGEGLEGLALQERQLLVGKQEAATARAGEEDVHTLPGLPFQVSTPLMIEGEPLGVLSLSHPHALAFPEGALQILQAIGDQLALAVHREQLAEALQNQVDALHQLYEISAGLVGHMHMAGVIFLLLRSLTDVLPHALTTAFYVREGEAWRRAKVYTPHTSPGVDTFWQENGAWEEEVALLERCRRQAQAANSVLARLASFKGREESAPVAEVLYLPLGLPTDEFYGVIAVALGTPAELAPQQLALIQTYLQQGAAALYRVRLYEASREEEGRLRAILEASRDGIFLVGEDLGIRYANERALQLLGLPGGRNRWEGRSFVEAIALLRERAADLAGHLLGNLRDLKSAVFTTRDGETHPAFETAGGRYLTLHRWPVQMDHEQVVGALFLFRDVTERITLEHMRDDLLHMLVHDLRNPVSVIINGLVIIADPAMADVVPEAAQLALKNAEQILTLVNAILDIGQLESGRLQIHPEPVRLADLVAPLKPYLALSGREETLELQVPKELPLMRADRLFVERVLRNLLDNALKFTPPDGRIRISAREREGEIEVECYNNGPPIPREVQDRLFEKFVRGDHQGQGYGLGLAFCRLAIEAHGGRIWAENHPEVGVSFFFTLPTAESD
ncbi:MAG: GAF domain-containing protein [Anaerolineales bacterium]